MISFVVKTSKRCEMIDITDEVMQSVHESGISEGIATIFIPHTTAGVTINENADPSVVRDILTTLDRVIPRNGDYMHSEGNSDSHIKAGMMGFSTQVIVHQGKLALGTWQGIYFCEFDGPRNRKVWVKVIGE